MTGGRLEIPTKFSTETTGPYIPAVGKVNNCNRSTLYSGGVPLHYVDGVRRPGKNSVVILQHVLEDSRAHCKHSTSSST